MADALKISLINNLSEKAVSRRLSVHPFAGSIPALLQQHTTYGIGGGMVDAIKNLDRQLVCKG
jgi:hypothetical protein